MHANKSEQHDEQRDKTKLIDLNSLLSNFQSQIGSCMCTARCGMWDVVVRAKVYIV